MEDNKELSPLNSTDSSQEEPVPEPVSPPASPNRGESQGGLEQFDVSQTPSPETPPQEAPPQPKPERELPSEQEPSVETGETYNIGSPTYQPLPTTPYEEEIQSHANEIIPLPEEQKLSELKRVAKEKSVEKAVAVVKKMNDPWLEDKFHDDLMDDPELRAQLENLGKLEKL